MRAQTFLLSVCNNQCLPSQGSVRGSDQSCPLYSSVPSPLLRAFAAVEGSLLSHFTAAVQCHCIGQLQSSHYKSPHWESCNGIPNAPLQPSQWATCYRPPVIDLPHQQRGGEGFHQQSLFFYKGSACTPIRAV